MRLKQIKLAGFKSFVDPTTVTLPGNRCAVVGPNGCCKSNIIDAVRWVMGESSAKQLRGESLTDVIFNGSNSRKPTAAASIELFFDNSDGRIGGEYSAYAEIAIRRQVTRDGQSNYFLNGNKCRRRDIQDIFLGTGFGPRSYSIIEQGMISQLVEAKPEELRVYLEEAAGISKYKERRRETENRIKHTRENLERINDIREELARQLDRLQRQAQAAERYRELRAEESLVTAQLYVLRHSNLHSELSSVEERIKSLEIDQEKTLAAQRELEAEIEKSRQAHAEHTDGFNQVQGQFYQLGADIARIEEAIAFNEQRVKQLELDLQSVAQRSLETERQLSMDETQIAELTARLDELNPQVAQRAAQDATAQEALAAAEAAARTWQTKWDEFNSSAAQNDREAEVQASRIEHLEQLLLRLRRRQQELEQLQADQGAYVDSGEMDQLAEQISGLEDQSRLLNLQIDECLAELGAAREDVLLREQVLEEARTEVQNLRHELASLQAVQNAALGQSVQEAESWIAAHSLSDSARLGESLAVVPGWERAVETVLGHFLSALQVDNLDDFAASLADLPEGDLALVEINTAGRVGGEAVNSAIELPSLNSLVRADAVNAISLLHGIYAAESTLVALAARGKLLPGQSIITREGFWVGRDWVRVLHDHDHEAGIIQRGQQIETLNVRVEEAERTLGELQRHVQQGRARVESLESQREELQQGVNALQQNLSERRTDHGVTRVKLEEADARREQLLKDYQDIVEQLETESGHLDTARERLTEAELEREQQAQVRVKLTDEREALDAALLAARDKARSSRDDFYALNVEKEGLQSRLAASQTARERLLAQQRELASQHDNLTAGISTSTTPLPDLQQELEVKLASRLDVENRLGQIRAQMENAEQQTRELESARQAREQSVAQLREQLEGQRVERQGLSVQETNLLEQVRSTGHDAEQVRREMPEEATENAWAEELDRLGRRIARLGAINLAAIEEYEQESQRKVYLDAQAEDLESALETLLEAIRKIDKETRTRFKQTFEAVNSRLGELFPKVFGGGHAYLELTGEDLLDTGVSLMARPPGKRNASVHLLSGGEKAMTAVALIFAIFHLNPSPVCLLDEVDAPLDDANVSRFASLIEEMSADVQFLVITHNKITMEMADYLMGVTMQEPGVSRLVSVDVDEAAAMAV
jgi:chromosome segregation protein